MIVGALKQRNNMSMIAEIKLVFTAIAGVSEVSTSGAFGTSGVACY